MSGKKKSGREKLTVDKVLLVTAILELIEALIELIRKLIE